MGRGARALRNRVIVAAACGVAGILLACQLLIPPIVGLANNGDFERSMGWAGIDYLSSDGTVLNVMSNMDNDDNGFADSGAIRTGVMLMRPGTLPVNDGDSDSNTNFDVDFGFYQLSLGNRVFEDMNNDGLLGAGEAGEANVLVELFDDLEAPLVTPLAPALALAPPPPTSQPLTPQNLPERERRSQPNSPR